MKKLILIVLCICSNYAYASNLQPSDATLIKEAGIPIYSKSNFVTGNADVGFRFATMVTQNGTLLTRT